MEETHLSAKSAPWKQSSKKSFLQVCLHFSHQSWTKAQVHRKCSPVATGLMAIQQTIFCFEREAENRSFCRQPAVSALQNKSVLNLLGWTAGHSVGARRKEQQWETAGWIWTVLQKKKDRLVSRELLRAEVRIVHTTGPNLFWKLLFQLRSQISVNSSGSNTLSLLPHILTYMSHRPYFCSHHFTIQSPGITRSSTKELATLSRSM